jgi:hypothetical protein
MEMKYIENELLFQQLLEKTAAVVARWDDYYRGASLSHFDGFSEMYYISSTIMKDVLELVKNFHSGLPSEDLSPDISYFKEEFDSLSNPFHQYLSNIPELMTNIAWFMESFFNFYTQLDKVFSEEAIKKDIARAEELLKMKFDSTIH